jgi:hypothetical protein
MDLPNRLPQQTRLTHLPRSEEKHVSHQSLAITPLRDAGLARVLIRNRAWLPPLLSKNPRRPTMKTNEGNLDRVLRVVAGLVLLGLAATGKVGIWGYIGVVPLLTGAVGFCPLYTVLGINTCPARD